MSAFPGFSAAEEAFVLRLMLSNAEARERTLETLYRSERAAHKRAIQERDRLAHILDEQDRRIAWLTGRDDYDDYLYPEYGEDYGN